MPTDPSLADTYHVAFDTLSLPGKIVVTCVSLRTEIVEADAFDERVFRVDLCDHPKYPALVRYVKDNPKSTLGS